MESAGLDEPCLGSSQLTQLRPHSIWMRNLGLVWTGCSWVRPEPDFTLWQWKRQNELLSGASQYPPRQSPGISQPGLYSTGFLESSDTRQISVLLCKDVDRYFPSLLSSSGAPLLKALCPVTSPLRSLSDKLVWKREHLTVKPGSPQHLRTYWHLLDSFPVSGKHLSRSLCSICDGPRTLVSGLG